MTHCRINALASALAILLFTLPVAGDEVRDGAMDDALAQYQLQLERVQRYAERIKPHSEAIQELLQQLQAGEIDLDAFREAIVPHQQAIKRIERQMRRAVESESDAKADAEPDTEPFEQIKPYQRLFQLPKPSTKSVDALLEAGMESAADIQDYPEESFREGIAKDDDSLSPNQLMQRYQEVMQRYGHAMRILIERMQQQQISGERFQEIMEEQGRRILENQRQIQPGMNRLAEELRRRQVAIRADEDPDKTRPADFDAFARQLDGIVNEIERTTIEIETELGIDPPRQNDDEEE